jgi:hypothetical protein
VKVASFFIRKYYKINEEKKKNGNLSFEPWEPDFFILIFRGQSFENTVEFTEKVHWVVEYLFSRPMIDTFGFFFQILFLFKPRMKKKKPKRN